MYVRSDFGPLYLFARLEIGDRQLPRSGTVVGTVDLGRAKHLAPRQVLAVTFVSNATLARSSECTIDGEDFCARFVVCCTTAGAVCWACSGLNCGCHF